MTHKVQLSELHRISIGILSEGDEGDFLDVLTNNSTSAVYFFGVCEDDSKIVAYHAGVGNLIVATDSIDEAVDALLQFEGARALPENILKPLILSAYHNDLAFLANELDNSELEVCSASEMDDVSEYKSPAKEAFSLFAIGAVSYDTDAEFDLDSHCALYEGEEFESLSDLCGYFDEETWVIILKPIRDSSESLAAQTTSDDNSVTSLKFCSQCGQKLPPNSKFCSSCGAKIIAA